MKIENYHCIKSLDLPEGWLEVKPGTSLAPRSIRVFSPAEEAKVKIVLLNEGIAIEKDTLEAFRKLLKSAPRVVFDRTKQDKPAQTDIQLMSQIRRLLGHVGNNQITNLKVGLGGPVFDLERLDILVWNSRPVLMVRGWFCNPDNRERINAYCGFFVEDDSDNNEGKIEQIYLEAATESLYEQYLSVFETVMRSVQWTSQIQAN